MQLYTDKDIDLINEKIDAITDAIEKKKLDIFKPTKKSQMAANEIVLEFVRQKKRKVYGGFAQNKVIVAKNPADAFYEDDIIPDVDVYSPEPLKDLVELCDLLYSRGFKDINGQEAQHKETYKIFVDQANVIDLSYVPRNIYNKMPFIEIDGINYIHPVFVNIDMYRMITDPYFSGSHRWKKTFPRLQKLQKHYPFPQATKELNNAYDVPKDKVKLVTEFNKKILKYCNDKETIIFTGQYAYNVLLQESGIMKDKKLGGKYKLIDTPFMQIVSTNYIPDTVNIILALMQDLDNDPKLTYKEYYPLWMFTGYSTVIYYDELPILHITGHNNRCVPIKKIESRFYSIKGVEVDKKHTIQIGSFDFVLLLNMISWLRVRINGIEEKQHYHNIMTSHLVEMRNYYLKTNNKNLLDDTIFQSYIPDCIGDTMDPARESRLLREKKYKEGKLVMFRYNPEKQKSAPDYKFANTSGNEIHKSINYKIKKYLDNPSLLESFIKKSYDEQIEENEVENSDE